MQTISSYRRFINKPFSSVIAVFLVSLGWFGAVFVQPVSASSGTPKVGIAVTDLWKNSSDAQWQKDTASSSMMAITQYVKEKKAAVQVIELTMPANTKVDDAAAIQLAREGGLDLLVLGSTNSSPVETKQATAVNPWMMTTTDVMAGGRKYTFTVHAQWRVISTATGEVVDVVSGRYLPAGVTSEAFAYDIEAARSWARERLLAGLTDNLLDKVQTWWSSSDRSSRLKVAQIGKQQPVIVPVAPQPVSRPPQQRFATRDIDPPIITLLNPQITRGLAVVVNSSVRKIIVEGKVRDAGGVASLMINGKSVNVAEQGAFRGTALIEGHEAVITLRAVDKSGNVATREFAITRKGGDVSVKTSAQISIPGAKPVLWGVAIGVSNYATPSMNLEFADKDAKSLAHFFTTNTNNIFSEVNFKTLLNEEVTRSSIIDSISNHLGQAAANDVVFIFIAGHGIKHRQSGSYYFVPHDAAHDTILTRGLRMSDFDEIVKILKQNVHKVVVVMDTCHAGAMQVGSRGVEGGDDLAEALKNSSGLYILAASKGGEASLEASSYSLDGDSGHGAFTYSLIEAMSGKANYDKNDYISLNEIFHYVAKQVPRLTKGRQHPYSRVDGTDLPLIQIR